MIQKFSTNSTRYHFLEDIAPRAVRSSIDDSADAVWLQLSRPGIGGPDNCLSAQVVWAKVLLERGHRVNLLGSGMVIGLAASGGYRTSNGEVVDHHFLAVGDNLTLFDPTAGSEHIRHAAGMPLDRYVVADGRPFPEWRRTQLVAG
jgi:hypothetical protein